MLLVVFGSRCSSWYSLGARQYLEFRRQYLIPEDSWKL